MLLISDKCGFLPFPWRTAKGYDKRLVCIEFSHSVDGCGLLPRWTGQPRINVPLNLAKMMLNKPLPRDEMEPLLKCLRGYLKQSGVKVEKGHMKSNHLRVTFGIMLDVSSRANKAYYILSCVASCQYCYFGAEVYCRQTDPDIVQKIQLIDLALHHHLAQCGYTVT